jgi:hypothetical protein
LWVWYSKIHSTVMDSDENKWMYIVFSILFLQVDDTKKQRNKIETLEMNIFYTLDINTL